MFAAGDVRHGSAKELPVRSAKDPSQWDPSTATSPRPPHSKDRPRRDGLDRHKLGRSRDAEPRCAAWAATGHQATSHERWSRCVPYRRWSVIVGGGIWKSN